MNKADLDKHLRKVLRQSQQAEQALAARLAQEVAGQAPAAAAAAPQSPWHRLSVQHQRRGDELERQVQQLEVQLREAVAADTPAAQRSEAATRA